MVNTQRTLKKGVESADRPTLPGPGTSNILEAIQKVNAHLEEKIRLAESRTTKTLAISKSTVSYINYAKRIRACKVMSTCSQRRMRK